VTGSAEPLRVAQLPDRSALNPVLERYREALEANGVHVVRHDLCPRPDGRPPVLSVRWLAANRSLSVVHFHWYQRLYLRRGWARSWAALGRFATGLLLARLLGVQLTWMVHNLQPHDRPFPKVDRVSRAILARLAALVFVDSELAGRLVSAELPRVRGKLLVTPLGGYATAYGLPLPRDEARRALAQHGVPRHGVLCLVFGLLRSYKGAVEAIETARRVGPSVHLLVAGDPIDARARARIEASAGGAANVHLILRHIEEEEVPVLFGAADAVATPYREVLLSGTFLLAATMARAVVAPRLGALAGGDPDGVVWYDPDDPLGLDAALRRVRDAADRDALGARLRSWVDLRSWDELGARVAGALRDVAASHSASTARSASLPRVTTLGRRPRRGA
jgi:glycosyltransferase involved in cell wall biosynthesis